MDNILREASQVAMPLVQAGMLIISGVLLSPIITLLYADNIGVGPTSGHVVIVCCNCLLSPYMITSYNIIQCEYTVIEIVM